MDEPILTWAWCLLGLNERRSSFAYSIHAMQCDSVDSQRWHFLTLVAMLMHMLLSLRWAQARVGTSGAFSQPVTKCDFKA